MNDPTVRSGHIRRLLPTLLLVTVAAVTALTLSPVVASQRLPAEAVATPPAAAVGTPVASTGVATSAGPAAPAAAAVTSPPEANVPGVSSIRRAVPAEPSATIATRAALKKRLDGIRDKYAIPGISVAIIFPDGGTWVGTAGVADLESGEPVTPDTAFAIASVTKTFTAALVMALGEEGLLGLDVPVVRYLPDLRIDERVTVRHLLDHTSGLRDYFFHPRIDSLLLDRPSRRWTEGDAMRYVGKAYFKPGRGWRYSNTNYLVLGMLAERVGGAPLAAQLRSRFIEPLGLSDTYYQPAESPAGAVAHGYRFASTSRTAKAVGLSDGSPIVPFTSVITAAGAAGGMASSASDLARWARALYAGRVLQEASVQAMVDDVARTRRFEPSLPYGLGVQMVDVAGRTTLGHSGRLLGFRSVVRWLPQERVAIAVLTNQSRTDPGIIARALLKIALKPSRDCICADRR